MTVHIFSSLDIRPYFTWIRGGVTLLVVETNQGPVLIDAGLGRQDHSDPNWRMRWYKNIYRASRGLEKTAFHLVQEIGYSPEALKHIVLTHAHLDHAGGLADFPWAKVHLLQKELDFLQNHSHWRYLPSHWAHQPKWQAHTPSGDKWFGFDAIQLDGFTPEIWLIPLMGHTPGLAGVAIQKENGWLLYGSDSLPYNARIDLVPHWFARFFMYHHAPRIRHLLKENPNIQLLSGHMPSRFYKNNKH